MATQAGMRCTEWAGQEAAAYHGGKQAVELGRGLAKNPLNDAFIVVVQAQHQIHQLRVDLGRLLFRRTLPRRQELV